MQRDPIIQLTDTANKVGYKLHPDEFYRYVKKDGIEKVRKDLHDQLDLAIERGLSVINVLDKSQA